MTLPARPALRSIPIYPAALVAAFVTSVFLESAEALPVLPRPIVAGVVIVVVVQVVLSLLSRNALIGAYVAATGLLLLIAPLVGLGLVAAGFVPLLLGLRGRRRIERGDWLRLTAGLNLIAVLVLLVNAGLLVQRVLNAEPRQTRAAVAPAGAPDIYVILLDGYPRADTLRDEFAFDNTPFLASMEQLSFEVAGASHSNYNSTILTTASMFSMRPIEVIPGGTGNPHGDERRLVRELNTAAGLAGLRGLGYEVVAIPPGMSVYSLYGADQVLDTGQVNSFEVGLVRAAFLRFLLPDLQRTWFHDQARERLTDSLALLGDLGPSDHPRFVYAHLSSPHPPTVFAADGSIREGTTCFPQTCDLWSDVYDDRQVEAVRGQVAWLNLRVHDTIRSILANDPGAVVVVMSDHGRRLDVSDNTEMLRNLFMAYTPGHPGLFPDDASPINLLPRILNAYAGTNLPLAREDSWVLELNSAGQRGLFDLTPWSP